MAFRTRKAPLAIIVRMADALLWFATNPTCFDLLGCGAGSSPAADSLCRGGHRRTRWAVPPSRPEKHGTREWCHGRGPPGARLRGDPQRGVRDPAERKPHLPQAEQVEVVDEERG